MSRVAGDSPAEWWLPADEPRFAVWAVERLSSLQSPGLGRLVIVLPDGKEVPGEGQMWIIGGKHRLRPFVFDPALRSLPRLHLRLFAKDRPEPIDFDIPNPVFESATAAPATAPAL